MARLADGSLPAADLADLAALSENAADWLRDVEGDATLRPPRSVLVQVLLSLLDDHLAERVTG